MQFFYFGLFATWLGILLLKILGNFFKTSNIKGKIYWDALNMYYALIVVILYEIENFRNCKNKKLISYSDHKNDQSNSVSTPQNQTRWDGSS